MKKIVIVLGLAVFAIASVGCQKLKSRDLQNKGVQAYRNAKFSDAVEFFQQSIALDPSNRNGRLYLATAYFSQYVPGTDTPENQQMATRAREEFQKVLQDDPKDETALGYLASLTYQQAQGIPDLDAKFKALDESKSWNEKLVQVDPSDKEAWYSLGVIDWAETYPIRMADRAKLGMKPEDPGPIKDTKKIKVVDELKARNMPMVEDGIKNLQKALDLDPNYDDAMSYLNLMYREKADLEDSPEAYKKDIDTAESLVQKALATKKMKAAKQPVNQGIQADQ